MTSPRKPDCGRLILPFEKVDVVRIELNGRSLDLPVWIQPGHADDSITVTTGYGRNGVGRIADGVGFNVYQLTLTDNNYRLNSFNQIIDSISGEKSFNSVPVFYADLGCGYEHRFSFFKSYVVFLGVNISYKINFNKLRLKSLDYSSVYETPKINTGGLKVGATIRWEMDLKKNYRKRLSKTIDN